MSIATIKAHADAIKEAVDTHTAAIKTEADALPTGSAPAWPAPVNCLAGTVPSLPTNPFGASGTEYDSRRTKLRTRYQQKLQSGSIICLGTSITESWDVTQIHPACKNFGIGGDNVAGLLNRLGELQPCLSQAGAVVLEIGVNDCGYVNLDTVKSQLDLLFGWLTGPLVVLNCIPQGIIWQGSTPYLSQETLAAFNTYLTTKLAGRAKCQIANVTDALKDTDGWMKMSYSIGDRCHQNAAGEAAMNDPVSAALTAALAA